MLNLNEIGERIKSQRKRLGISRDRLAEMINLTPYFVGEIERGDKAMSLDTFVKISDGLEVSPDYLIYGQKEAPADASNLQELLNKCTDKERQLITDILKVAMPYLNGLK